MPRRRRKPTRYHFPRNVCQQYTPSLRSRPLRNAMNDGMLSLSVPRSTYRSIGRRKRTSSRPSGLPVVLVISTSLAKPGFTSSFVLRGMSLSSSAFDADTDPYRLLLASINHIPPKPRKILQLFRLLQINNGVFIRVTKATAMMLKYIEPYISYGFVH